MSKGQRGNKEAKKPKTAPAPAKPPESIDTTQKETRAALPRLKK